MIITEIINNLYTNPNSDWIRSIDESDIQPFVIQKWLVMNENVRTQVRLLDKYVFNLPPRMYLSLAWSIIPKVKILPFIPYIKELDDSEELEFILEMVRKEFKISNNDYKYDKTRIIKSIRSNMSEWFKYYGVEKSVWKKFNLDFSVMENT